MSLCISFAYRTRWQSLYWLIPDCRGLFAVIGVHVVMPGRRARALTSDLYCCVSIAVSFDIAHTPATHTCQ